MPIRNASYTTRWPQSILSPFVMILFFVSAVWLLKHQTQKAMNLCFRCISRNAFSYEAFSSVAQNDRCPQNKTSII